MNGYKEKVEEGDTVIIYVNYQQLSPVKVRWGQTYQCKYGAMKHEFMIGKPYGSKIQCTKGFVYVLHPTPILWRQVLRHRTQILYTPDISLILLQLDLKPGSRVVESGTGSGGLSHSIARCIAPNGHLDTFEFHEKRWESVKEEFEANGLSDIVTAHCGDVCSEKGFEGIESPVDAVFLDLPTPWLAVVHAKTVMKVSGGRFASFSPCIEQSQKTCVALRSQGFVDIENVECVVRSLKVQEYNMVKLKMKPSITSEESPQEAKMPRLDDKPIVFFRIIFNLQLNDLQ